MYNYFSLSDEIVLIWLPGESRSDLGSCLLVAKWHTAKHRIQFSCLSHHFPLLLSSFLPLVFKCLTALTCRLLITVKSYFSGHLLTRGRRQTNYKDWNPPLLSLTRYFRWLSLKIVALSIKLSGMWYTICWTDSCNMQTCSVERAKELGDSSPSYYSALQCNDSLVAASIKQQNNKILY